MSFTHFICIIMSFKIKRHNITRVISWPYAKLTGAKTARMHEQEACATAGLWCLLFFGASPDQLHQWGRCRDTAECSSETVREKGWHQPHVRTPRPHVFSWNHPGHQGGWISFVGIQQADIARIFRDRRFVGSLVGSIYFSRPRVVLVVGLQSLATGCITW